MFLILVNKLLAKHFLNINNAKLENHKHRSIDKIRTNFFAIYVALHKDINEKSNHIPILHILIDDIFNQDLLTIQIL